jgi:hypothetical protein
MQPAPAVEPEGGLVGDQRRRQAEQRRSGKVDPDFGELHRCSSRMTSAVAAMVSSVLATSATASASHSRSGWEELDQRVERGVRRFGH